MNATSNTPSTGPLATFRLDVKYTQVASALAAGGVRTILLKGPAFDQLLFDGRREREYSDIDLLLDPVGIIAAERRLEELGFDRDAPESAARRFAWRAGIVRAAHATAWVRRRDGFTIDLHHTLPGLTTPADEAWRALSGHVTTITVIDEAVESLDAAASALLIALHAAHHGPGWNRARTDLHRACTVLDRDCWDAAAGLARHLRSESAMGIGLGTVPGGSAMARELGLRSTPTLAYRVRWRGIAWRQRRRRG